VGEGVQLRLADLSANAFYPRIDLYGPTGNLITFANGQDVAAITQQLPTTGTFTVVAYDVSTGSAQSGNYNLYFTRAPGANEGGTLPNGSFLSGPIDKGDFAYSTFDRAAGEGVQLRLADLSANAFYPRIDLYGPAGNLVTFANGQDVAAITQQLPITGTYTVV